MKKIELKNVKHAGFASQETDCFEASVYIDGVRAGTVSNEGHGGANRYQPHDLQTKLDEHGKTLPPIEAYGEAMPQTADILIGELFSDFLAAKDIKRICKNRVMFIRDGRIMQTKTLTPQVLAQALSAPEATSKQLKADKILNGLPLEEAIRLFRDVYKKGAAATSTPTV